MSNTKEAELTVFYENYRGERRVRRILPVRWWFGKTKYHPTPGWMCTAMDLDRPEGEGWVQRDFALTGMLAIGQDAVDRYVAMHDALENVVRGG